MPFEKLQLEIGIDYLTAAGNPNDRYPWSGNAKLGIPEKALFGFSPSTPSASTTPGGPGSSEATASPSRDRDKT